MEISYTRRERFRVSAVSPEEAQVIVEALREEGVQGDVLEEVIDDIEVLPSYESQTEEN